MRTVFFRGQIVAMPAGDKVPRVPTDNCQSDAWTRVIAVKGEGVGCNTLPIWVRGLPRFYFRLRTDGKLGPSRVRQALTVLSALRERIRTGRSRCC
jgi:hypothetical protein